MNPVSLFSLEHWSAVVSSRASGHRVPALSDVAIMHVINTLAVLGADMQAFVSFFSSSAVGPTSKLYNQAIQTRQDDALWSRASLAMAGLLVGGTQWVVLSAADEHPWCGASHAAPGSSVDGADGAIQPLVTVMSQPLVQRARNFFTITSFTTGTGTRHPRRGRDEIGEMRPYTQRARMIPRQCMAMQRILPSHTSHTSYISHMQPIHHTSDFTPPLDITDARKP